ncbi:3-carboxy-cis,cis-muconate cycloisomerase [Streptomyces griseochromogenes]|uniref:3-carboxy-cis,cis-muconate cycloisomerase n=1 Tax=Streptomyces griseochromogenes TaxID=68214 RepID=A0ABS4LTD6_9ACTN|nr:adenylosuccinate lyase family protein [Streptomyces griseochromogenes]MBP2050680.1 3-carboxy-cis,cis-muconate cycloisomerase [Streptomyces griseochromogenes]
MTSGITSVAEPAATGAASALPVLDEADVGLLSPVRAATPVARAVGDTAWLQAMLDAEAALARAQAALGTVPAEAAKAITQAARAEYFDVPALAHAARETANPVVGLVQALTAVVARIDPEAAEYVHRGSTSQDILDTGAMLVAARALRLVHGDLLRMATALGDLARTHRGTPMAGRTLALHAVPTTFGLKAAGWYRLVRDAAERVERVLDHGLPVSLGGAAGTLAGYLAYGPGSADPAGWETGTSGGGDRAEGNGGARPADGTPAAEARDADYVLHLTRAFAHELGLSYSGLPWHCLRTPMADLAAALAHTTGALGKIALDVQSLARTEVGEVAEPTAAGRGASSAMPHKRNPVLATLMRSAALQVPALSGALTQCMLAEDERSAGAWHAEWQLLRECLRLAGGAAYTGVELARGLTVHPDRMRENLDLTGSQIVTERLAAALAPRLGKAAAKALLTEASAAAERSGRPLGAVLAARPQVTDHLTAAELAVLLDPAAYTGAAGALVDRALGPGIAHS